MSAFVIETGIPIPDGSRAFRDRVGGRPPGPLGVALDQMDVGQSIKLEAKRDYDRARECFVRLRPRRFFGMKLAGEGWRVWRVQ